MRLAIAAPVAAMTLLVYGGVTEFGLHIEHKLTAPATAFTPARERPLLPH